MKEGIRRGVIFGEAKYSKLGNVVKIKPPLVISEAQVERVLQVFEEIVTTMTKGRRND